MRDSQKELDIAKNIRHIEWLKSELLDNVAGLFQGFLRGSESALKDCLANIVVISYLLARRLGVRYSQFDDLIREKINKSLDTDREYESWTSDLNVLEHHFQNKK
jgi:hypothetical protein